MRTKLKQGEHHCERPISKYPGWGCNYRASVCQDGHWYCRIHTNEAVQKREIEKFKRAEKKTQKFLDEQEFKKCLGELIDDAAGDAGREFLRDSAKHILRLIRRNMFPNLFEEKK